jgi:hypothetical protein
MQFALPRLKGGLAGRKLTRAVLVEPCRSPALSIFFVDWLSMIVKFENVGENGEAGLHLGRRVPEVLPVVDSIQQGMANRTASDPSGEPADRA